MSETKELITSLIDNVREYRERAGIHPILPQHPHEIEPLMGWIEITSNAAGIIAAVNDGTMKIIGEDDDTATFVSINDPRPAAPEDVQKRWLNMTYAEIGMMFCASQGWVSIDAHGDKVIIPSQGTVFDLTAYKTVRSAKEEREAQSLSPFRAFINTLNLNGD